MTVLPQIKRKFDVIISFYSELNKVLLIFVIKYLWAKLSPPQITFTGLSHFNNKVLYMDPVKDDHLDVLTRIAGIH